MNAGLHRMQVTVRRHMILEDGLAALGHLGPALKGRVAATFVNQARPLPMCL